MPTFGIQCADYAHPFQLIKQIAWSTFLRYKSKIPFSGISQYSIETGCSLYSSQNPVTFRYAEPNYFSPYPPQISVKRNFNIIPYLHTKVYLICSNYNWLFFAFLTPLVRAMYTASLIFDSIVRLIWNEE